MSKDFQKDIKVLNDGLKKFCNDINIEIDQIDKNLNNLLNEIPNYIDLLPEKHLLQLKSEVTKAIALRMDLMKIKKNSDN